MSSSVGRNSLIMATGTAASRVTGQLLSLIHIYNALVVRCSVPLDVAVLSVLLMTAVTR